MVKVECSSCKKVNELSLQTKPLPPPHSDVVECFVECFYCSLRSGNHFLSPELIQAQVELRRAAVSWQTNQNKLNFNRLVKLRQNYLILFDSEQEKYKNFMKSLDSLKKAIAEHVSES